MLVAYCNLLRVSHQGIKTKIYRYWIFQKFLEIGQKVLKDAAILNIDRLLVISLLLILTLVM